MNKAAINTHVKVLCGRTFSMYLGKQQGEWGFLLVCLCCYFFNDERDLMRLQAAGKDPLEYEKLKF